jgi:hypothetical protein
LRDRKITAYIPLRDKKLGNGKYAPPAGFNYDRENNRYQCIAGNFLYPHKPTDGLTRYVIKNRGCHSCPLQAQCFPQGFKGRSMRIQRADFQDFYDAIRKRQKSPNFRKKRFERSWKVEGIFAEAKENHCLRRAKYRGLAKTQIQVYLSASVQNLKRLIKALGDMPGSTLDAFIQILARKSDQFCQKFAFLVFVHG